MKRTLKFCSEEAEYLIIEDSEPIFKILKKDLKFDSKLFYNGLFKDVNEYLEIDFTIEGDINGKDENIFNWIEKIISSVCITLNKELNFQPSTEENNEEKISILSKMEEKKHREIKLFDLRVCAGDGNHIFDEGFNNYTMINTDNECADYAVQLSGDSMEPNYPDKSIILIKKVEELNNGDVGIFYVDSEIMCKKYKKTRSKLVLEPINNEHKSVTIKTNTDCRIQGKVLGVFEVEKQDFC